MLALLEPKMSAKSGLDAVGVVLGGRESGAMVVGESEGGGVLLGAVDLGDHDGVKST